MQTSGLNQLTNDMILKAFFIIFTMVYKLRFERSRKNTKVIALFFIKAICTAGAKIEP
jgi:hypothetical protein